MTQTTQTEQIENTCLVYMIAPDRETALQFAREIVGQRLAACANILGPMQSVYHWQGVMQEDEEIVVLFKTTKEQFPALDEYVSKTHPYDCPCLVQLPITDGHKPFLRWIEEEVSGAHKEG